MAVDDSKERVFSGYNRVVAQTCELITVVTTYTRLTQVHAKQDPTIESGGGHKILLLAGELLAKVSCWKTVRIF